MISPSRPFSTGDSPPIVFRGRRDSSDILSPPFQLSNPASLQCTPNLTPRSSIDLGVFPSAMDIAGLVCSRGVSVGVTPPITAAGIGLSHFVATPPPPPLMHTPEADSAQGQTEDAHTMDDTVRRVQTAPSSPRKDAPESHFSFSFSQFARDIHSHGSMMSPCQSGPNSRSSSISYGGCTLMSSSSSALKDGIAGSSTSLNAPTHTNAASNSLFALNSDGSQSGTASSAASYTMRSDDYKGSNLFLSHSRDSSSGGSDWARNSMDVDTSHALFDMFPPLTLAGMHVGDGALSSMSPLSNHHHSHALATGGGGALSSINSASPNTQSMAATPTNRINEILGQVNSSHTFDGNATLQRELELLYMEQNMGLSSSHQGTATSVHCPPSSSPSSSSSSGSSFPLRPASVLVASIFPPPPTASDTIPHDDTNTPMPDAESIRQAAAFATSIANQPNDINIHTTRARTRPTPMPASSNNKRLLPIVSRDANDSRSMSHSDCGSPSYSPHPRTKLKKSTISSSSSSSSSSSLRRRNHGEPFECDRCSKTFTQKGGLMNHSRIHTGERPYACKVEGCHRAFTQKCNLTRHARCHTGEKPFECQLCTRAFNRRWGLLVHMKSHAAVANQPVVEPNMSTTPAVSRPTRPNVPPASTVAASAGSSTSSSHASVKRTTNQKSTNATTPPLKQHKPTTPYASTTATATSSYVPVSAPLSTRPVPSPSSSFAGSPSVASSHRPLTRGLNPTLLASQLSSLEKAASAFIKPVPIAGVKVESAAGMTATMKIEPNASQHRM